MTHASARRLEQRGFTLIEILVVLGIIAILAAIVIIAINPAKQFAQARNAQRQSNIDAILNAVGQRMADHKGVFGGDFTVGGVTYRCPALTGIGTSPIKYTSEQDANGVVGSNDLGDFSCLVPTYIATFPIDPTATLVANDYTTTGYEVSTDAAGRITVCAPKAKQETSIPDAADTDLCVKR